MACVFCQIAAHELDARIVYEDESAVAFYDILQAAPVHILVIPRQHITGPLDVDGTQEQAIGHLIAVAAHIARQEGIAESGYRLVTNQGRDGGQSVFHLHVHILGGRRMSWPPG
ncbi:MAG: histidine triad nucleotide-binding protein [Chloroflexi bacterium]|nr:histidine triad nucleotide-binding protein [Chloroflexota bacterium]